MAGWGRKGRKWVSPARPEADELNIYTRLRVYRTESTPHDSCGGHGVGYPDTPCAVTRELRVRAWLARGGQVAAQRTPVTART